MLNVLITGGTGDIAKAIKNELYRKIDQIEVFSPSRFEMDVSDNKSIEKYIINKKIDLLINNAGFIKQENLIDTSIENIQNTFSVNIVSVFTLCNLLIRKNPELKIINIGSSAGSSAKAGWSSYCSTKAAMIMATKCWHLEGIKAVCLSPGRTNTKMRKSLVSDEDLNTLLKVSDFAKVVYFIIKKNIFNGNNIDVNINNYKEILNEIKDY